MSVIKKYDMSSIVEVKDTANMAIKAREDAKYKVYTKDDIMLVRATNVFPINGVIEPLSDASFIVKSKLNFIYQALANELDYDKLKEIETCEVYYRSTVHFTENGLVSSHMYGNFDNQDFIILDPVSEHIGLSDIRNFAGQDTFIKGKVKLSSKAMIVIKAENYEKIKNLYPEIEDYNVVVYNGIPKSVKDEYIANSDEVFSEVYVNDEKAIVEKILLDLGYVPEIIGSHYIINSPTSDKIYKVNEELGEQYKVLSNAKHHYTEEYKEDIAKNILISDVFNKMLLKFIIDRHNINNVIDFNDEINRITAYKLIELFGVDEIINDIKLFNDTVNKMVETRKFPTSAQLLDSNIPDVYSSYVEFSDILNYKLN